MGELIIAILVVLISIVSLLCQIGGSENRRSESWPIRRCQINGHGHSTDYPDDQPVRGLINVGHCTDRSANPGPVRRFHRREGE